MVRITVASLLFIAVHLSQINALPTALDRTSDHLPSTIDTAHPTGNAPSLPSSRSLPTLNTFKLPSPPIRREGAANNSVPARPPCTDGTHIPKGNGTFPSSKGPHHSGGRPGGAISTPATPNDTPSTTSTSVTAPGESAPTKAATFTFGPGTTIAPGKTLPTTGPTGTEVASAAPVETVVTTGNASDKVPGDKLETRQDLEGGDDEGESEDGEAADDEEDNGGDSTGADDGESDTGNNGDDSDEPEDTCEVDSETTEEGGDESTPVDSDSDEDGTATSEDS